MASMTPDAELALFGSQTALFEKFGNFYNRISRETRKPIPDPITDFREALVLLYEPLNSRAKRCLKTKAIRPDSTVGPAIHIAVYSSGYGGDELTYAHNFPLSDEVFEELKASGVLEGTPHWGYTDYTELRLGERATERLIDECNKYYKEQAASEGAAEASAKP